jgi:hypothetical protein
LQIRKIKILARNKREFLHNRNLAKRQLADGLF